MTEIGTVAHDPFVTAELSYRLERARRDYAHGALGGRTHRRFRLPRRRILHLPPPRQRPLAVS